MGRKFIYFSQLVSIWTIIMIGQATCDDDSDAQVTRLRIWFPEGHGLVSKNRHTPDVRPSRPDERGARSGSFDDLEEKPARPFFGDFFYAVFQIYAPIHGYLSIIVCVFGIIANVINITVLTR